MNGKWEKRQKLIYILETICVLGWLLLFLLGQGGFVLVIGRVDSGDFMALLFLVFLLVLMVWVDGAILQNIKGAARVAAMAAALFAEGLALVTVLFFASFFWNGHNYIPLYNPAGEVGLVAREESWFFSVWGEFYRPVAPGLLRDTGVSYAAHDIWPFADGRCEMEWTENQVVIRYDSGVGDWEACTIPLN